jgi:4'-phosphopantetheinyl transferase
MLYYQGKLQLVRSDIAFEAGFCVIKATLPALLSNIDLLHPNENLYYNSLKFDLRKKSYLLGRIAAKKAILCIQEIVKVSSISVDFGIFKFPIIKCPEIKNMQVTIAHCEDIGIAIAFPEEHPLAVDIEKVDNKKTDTLKNHISVSEVSLIKQHGLSDAVGYTLLWSIKEALTKAIKTGLTADIKILEIASLNSTGHEYLCTFRNFMQYKAYSFVIGMYVVSIVLPGKTDFQTNFLHSSLIKIISPNS